MKVNNFDNPVINRKGDIQTLEEYSERNNVIMSDEFVPDKTYNPGDFVIYRNTLWKCLVTCIGVIPTEGLHWTKISLGEASSELFDEIANLIKVEAKTAISGLSVNANSNSGEKTINIAKEGYTPLGIVRYYFSGTNSAQLGISELFVSGSNLYVIINNNSNTNASNITFQVGILYVKS